MPTLCLAIHSSAILRSSKFRHEEAAPMGTALSKYYFPFHWKSNK